MEGCPNEDVNLLFLVLSAFLGLFIFLCVITIARIKKCMKRTETAIRKASMKDSEYHELQLELYGKKVLKRLQHMPSSSLHFKTSKTSGASFGKGEMDMVNEE